MDIEAALREQVAKATGVSADQRPVTKLKGDASNRSYYRVGQFPESHILMVMPKDAQRASEEATSGGPPSELPFVNVHRYLTKLGVRVPKILRFDEAASMMVLEDLGDVTFEAALLAGESRERLYGQAVDLLAKLRARTEKQPDGSCLAFGRQFDEPLYIWELHHFREWGMEAWSGKQPTPKERAELEALFKKMAGTLAQEPKGFTHRDYQSRNLMLKGGELIVIDFQDALLGPRQYDLVALLRDSYVELDDAFVDAMLSRYLQGFAAESGQKLNENEFKDFFYLLTIQRKLKDAARFEYIHRVKGNSSFLPSIPASLRYVKAAFAKKPEWAGLQEIASRYVPQLS